MSSIKKIRTRYAPSPTGFLHVGGARTALFNYLFAKHNNGDFIFRLEDTDISRNIETGESSQLDNLKWLGIIPDESPKKPNKKYGKYRQSEKIDRYNEIIDLLIKENKAYIAYDNYDELEQQKREQEKKGSFSFRYDRDWLKISEDEKTKRYLSNQYSIRISLPKNKTYEWNDLVRGKISVNTNEIGDFVIKKSDGYPTYNFAVVIDDHDMEISHVFRGEEHITNTPKQLAIYDLLNWEPPMFGHLTIITNMEGKKLSKRDFSLSQFIEDYKNEGYIPEAIFNFLALLGWSDKDSIELMSPSTLIKRFDYQRLSKSPSKFDVNKMNWFSKQYLKNIDNKIIISKLKCNNRSKEWLDLFVSIYKENASNIKQIQESMLIYDMDLPLNENNNEIVKEFIKNLKNNIDFTIDNIQNAINQTKNNLNVNGKNLFMPIRIATTGQEHGPELAKCIFLFGKDKIFQRLGIK